MFSVFPELLFLSPLAPFLIRIALTGVFFYAALRHFVSKRNDGVRTFGFAAGSLHALWIQPDADVSASVGRLAFKILWVLEVAISISFLIGIYTQVVAIAGGILAIEWLVSRRTRPVTRGVALLTFVMCLSLLMTGAGTLAFDLPL